jgi:hypothetical protein
LIGDVDDIVRIEPLLSRFDAQQYVQTFGVWRNRNFGGPFRRTACRSDWHGREIRRLVEAIDDAIFADHRRVANVDVGGVLAGGGGLSCKLQAGVGALDLI